ncbi:Hypothetical predicted protein [Mytilus galloprovincialis]|uniref:PiggyBac transposable element-derived protein domain-containing protein n=1 Tax=Mytilus galloprovincialis TaxID=29158 RepID=A0A8B6DW29_MYTGA|nr:Hypothetical predicted protein [Mytilus galloprovincialis]
MSESSDEEFDGFSPNEVDLAAQRYNDRLEQLGIGDLDVVDSDNEFSDENDPLVDEAGDRPAEADGWHANFDYYERGLPHIFLPRGNTGPTTVLDPDKEPVDFFSLLFTNAILQYIIQETDRYANKQIRDLPDENKSPWITPTVEEMKAFLGLCFLMGINVKPDIKSYWSTDVMLETPYFSKVMKRDRYMQIMRYIHFSNSEQAPQPGDPNYSKLYKIESLMDMFTDSMVSQYIPKRQLSVDEVMVPFKGRLSFKQYMPAKPTKWGIKMWAIAEANTGYVSYCQVYCGKTDGAAPGLANRVVKNCIEKANIIGQGYHVYMDNYFTSPALFTDLFQHFNTAACGTVRINRRELPKDIMKKNPEGVINRGDMQFRQKDAVAAVVWKDKKNVNLISSIHDFSVGAVQRNVQQADGIFQRQEIPCPQMISDYTQYMGGVDRADQYIQYYVFQHKTLKWPKRIFFTMIEMLKFDAFRLFLASPHHQPGPGKRPTTFLKFSKAVAAGLIAGYTGGSVRKGRPSLVPVDDRLTQRHLPGSFGNKSWCHVCHMRVKNNQQETCRQTKFGCLDCGKHLCLPECFTVFHSVKKLLLVL